MGSQRRTPPPPPPRPSKKKAGEGMWQAWWLLLLALCAVLVVILGLIWLFIEFPGLAGWKEVSKESAEGRARQEKWRRDSVILGELQRRGRRVTVDQLVTDLEEVLVVKSDPKNLRRCSSTKMRRSATQVSMCNSSSGVSSGDSRQQSPRLEEVHLPSSSREVRLPSSTREAHLPSSTREVHHPSSSSRESHLPSSSREVGLPSSARGGREKGASHSSRGGFQEVDLSLHSVERSGGGGGEGDLLKNCENTEV